MNQQEKQFIESIKDKISKFKIKTTLQNALDMATEEFTETHYNDGTSELINIGVERYLCSLSPYYFIRKYAWIDLPGVGTIPFKLYYFQENMLLDVLDFQKIVCEKVRQCLTEDNFVLTDKGYISIKDVKAGDKIETIAGDSIIFTEVKDSFYTGKREVCRILTNSGLALDCTLDHKIFTKRGWIKTEELNLKDEIISIINKGKFGNFELGNDKFATFIGYYIADGRCNSPSFVNTNINYINEILEAGKLFENCDPYIYKRKNNEIRQQAYEVKFVSKSKNSKLYRPIKNFIHKFGLDTLSKFRYLTNELMSLNERQMSILLNRLYAGDGWITCRSKKGSSYIIYEIGLGSSSYKLIKQIEYILQTKYGICCYISECFDKKNKNRNRFWKLRISKKKSVIDFINKIGIKGKTDTENIINLISRESPYNINQSFEKIRKIVHKKGTYDVYDITTKSSNFLANGLLVHNCGLSTIFSLYCLWRMLFKQAEDIDVVSLKQLKAQAFVSKMDSTLKFLPAFLLQRKIKDNEQQLQFENGSRIVSESQSENAGRSDTLSLLVLDEAAHYKSEKMVRGIVAAAQPTLSRTNGQFVILSTPNKTSGPGAYYYEQVTQAKLGFEVNTKIITVDWWEMPDSSEIEGPKKGYNQILSKYIEKNYYNKSEVKKEAQEFFNPIAENNWRDNPWLKKQHEDLGEILYKQEVLHNFIVGGNAVFSEDILKRTEFKTKEPIEMNKLGSLRADGVWFWKKPISGHRYIMGCLPTGEKVLTENGLKNIENIELKENLINRDGNKVKIFNKQITYNFKDYVYDIKLEGILRRTKFTENHPIFSSINTKLCRKHGCKRYWDFNFKFNKAEELNKDDWVVYPNIYRKNILRDDEILSKWPKNITRYNFEIKNPLLDEEFWWFIGNWLAEGWTENWLYSKSIHTTHNLKTEQKYVERIKFLFEKYNRKVNIRIKENCNSISTVFNSIVLYEFLNENFGKYAKNKKIPEWIKYLPEKFKIKIIEGYLNGDGNISIDERRNNYYIEFISISSFLLEDVQDILYSLGIISTLNILREEGITEFPNGKISETQKTYILKISHHYSLDLLKKLKYKILLSDIGPRSSIGHSFFSDDLNYIYFKIQNITKIYYEGNVYNFETEDHTFLCKNIITHNCDIASGTGVETSSFQILDVANYEQVCEYKGMISTKMFGRLVKNAASYYNQAFVVIECNGIGEAVFNEVYYHDTEPYQNVYKQKKIKNNISRMTGWITDPKTRKLITNELIDWFSVDSLWEELKIYSKRVYLEMATWIWDGNKPIHDSGASDDTLFALSLALYLRAKAINTGESFLINEKGDFIEYIESKDNEEKSKEENSGFDFASNEENESTDDFFFKKQYGMSKEDYIWLTKS